MTSQEATGADLPRVHGPAVRPGWQRAYEAQMALWRWYGEESGRRWLDVGYRVNAEALSKNSQLLLASLYRAEEPKVLNADPIFVSADMVDLVEAASESFAPEPLIASDIFVRDGFLWFERPIMIRDRFDEEMALRAFSWCPSLSTDRPLDREHPEVVIADEAADPDGTYLVAYGDGSDPDKADITGVALTVYADVDMPQAPLGFAPSHMTPWWYEMSYDGNEVDENDRPTGAAWWWRVLQTTLRLMQQRIAVRHPERPGRPTRREAIRHGFVDRSVLVVRLRKEKGDSHEPGEGASANYSHRFIVGGHWRNQWYPSGQVHRQIWISPYVKGPDDLPLVVAPNRAYTWSR